MKRLALACIVLATAMFSARSGDNGEKDSSAYEALRKEYNEVKQQFAKDVRDAQKAVDGAKSDEEKAAAQEKLAQLQKSNPDIKFGPRFLEFAEKNPQDPKASDAALAAYRLSSQPDFKRETRDTQRQALKFIKENFADKPEVKRVLRELVQSEDAAGEALYRAVLAKNPDARLQAWACKGLAAATIDKDEAAKLKKDLAGKYAEFFPNLSIGKPVPNVSCKDLDDKEVKLSDYKGSVVVIDIWATWCGPCRAMIPHEREMVERLKDKKFKLVSVSLDAQKKTVADFVAKEKMDWTHLWAGQGAGWIEDWNVESIPAIYVIDADGTIRYTNVRGDKLEEAVNKLLKEMEEK